MLTGKWSGDRQIIPRNTNTDERQIHHLRKGQIDKNAATNYNYSKETNPSQKKERNPSNKKRSDRQTTTTKIAEKRNPTNMDRPD